MSSQTHYQVLGLTSLASADEIKAAYRKLAMQYHPDRNPGDAVAEQKFKEISAAHDILKDPEKKGKYDTELNDPFGGNGFRTRQQQPHDFSDWGRSHGPNYDEILKDIYKRRGQNPGQRYTYEGVKNKDITLEYNITLEDAFHGKETTFKYKVGGESRSLNLKIPRGIKHGMKIRYEGKGDRSHADVKAGDLFVTISVMEHKHFTREGNDLYVTARVDFLDAMLGGSVSVPTIDGSAIRLRIAEGTPHGKVMRVPGRGMADATGARGDMFVETELVPTQLSEEEKAILRELRDKRNG